MNTNAYDQLQESLALMRMLGQSAVDVESMNLRDSEAVFASIRRMIAKKRKALK